MARDAGQEETGLHVLTSNETAHGLYLRAGFVDIEPSLDGTGVVMRRRLDG